MAGRPPPSTKFWHVLDALFTPRLTADSDVAARRLRTLPLAAGSEGSRRPSSAPPYLHRQSHTPGLSAPRGGLRTVVSLRHNLDPLPVAVGACFCVGAKKGRNVGTGGETPRVTAHEAAD